PDPAGQRRRPRRHRRVPGRDRPRAPRPRARAVVIPGGETPGTWLALRALEGQAHDGAALLAGLGDDRAVLGGRQAPDDVEAHPDAPEAAAVARLALHEPLEDPLVVTLGDADALVFDVDLDHRTDGAGAYRDCPAGRRVLEGVLEQPA